MLRTLNARFASLSRPERAAGIAVALIVTGIGLRFVGPAIVLPVVAFLRSVSDEMLTLSVQAFGLFEILLGLGLLVLVARHIRSRRATAETTTTSEQG